jgi:hypothetical protein
MLKVIGWIKNDLIKKIFILLIFYINILNQVTILQNINDIHDYL